MKSFKIIFSGILFLVSCVGVSQNVNEFTGSLNYGLPLLNIPSDQGNGISVSASYNAGIAVKQTASELGLGWSLIAGGAITRNVSGIADDCKGCSVWNSSKNKFRTENGTLYTPSDADLYHTTKHVDSLAFMFPDYDNYFVSGPGIGGKMTPYIFDYKMYYTDTSGDSLYKIDPSYSGLNKSSQFNFNGDFADTLVSRHYSVTPVSAATPFRLPNSAVTGLTYVNVNTEPYLGKSQSGSSIVAENFDPSTNRLGSANYVEYFRNSQIDSISITGHDIPGFVDFQSTHTRTSSVYPSSGIGAFRITNPSGFVYHYSLPVYINQVESHTYPLQNDYTIPSYSATLNSYSTSATSFTWSLNGYVVTKTITQNKYAYQWLLTAITGPDYVDSNSNHIVDTGDSGYWVSFDYQPWCTNFATRSPHYGFDYNFGLDESTERLPITVSNTVTSGVYKLSGKSGNVNLTYQQIYCLNKIKTTSHTAIFVKDVRNDEVSSHITTNYTATITPTPQLRTTRVILFKNDRLDSITTSTPPIAIATTGTNTVFDFSGTKNSNAYFFTENWYTTNLAAQIQSRVLKNIEFTQDYSLCRNYHGNVAVSSLTCSVITPPGTVQSNTAATTYSTSGKLTLTKIQSYEFQNVKIVPSYTFDYNQSVANNNPDYDPRKMDYWGYYKSDITSNGYSGYTSSTSKNYTDAWSLRKVTQPLGGYTQFDYESNSYTQVLDNTNGYRGASFIFPITTVTKNTCTNTCNYLDLTLEEGSQTPNEFLPLISGTITGLTKQACVPVGEYTNTAIGYATYTAIGYPNPFWGNYEAGSIYGKCNYTGTISPITLTTIEKEGYQNSYCITGSPTGTLAPASSGVYSYYDPACPSCVSDYYSGNGYMLFQTPVGYEVYGGGPRVKRIKTSNNSNETYVQEYTYQNGVATGEADRFEYPEPKLTCGDIYPFIYKLKPASIDKHNMGVGIGYSKVTVKNLGRSNTANGSIISNFITSYTVNGTTLTPNYQTTLTQTLTGADRVRYFECVDKYSPYWGLKTEDDVLDVNNNFVSKTTYEYQTTDQGAVIENFLFRDMVTAGAYTNRYNLSILRHYPVVLKKTKSYGVGSYMDSETLKRDQVTGEAVLMRSSGLNASTALSSKIPAFRISTFSAMGPKSVNSSNTNVLSPEAFSFSAVDTALIGNSSDFLSASALAFTNQALVMTYTNSGFVRSAITLPYWKQGASYGWAGIKGSIDSYGLYTRSELTSNPFNFATPSSSGAQWRFGSETTLSDAVGHALETRSYNNRFNSVRFGYNNDYVLATCANSNYASFTYSGFEMITPNTSNNFADGEMTLPVSAYTLVPASTITPHTGYKSIAVASGNNIYYSHGYSNTGVYETGIERGRMYRVIVWVNASAPNDCYLNALVTGSLSGSSYSQNYIMYPNDANAITIGNWKRLYVDFKVPADIVPNSGGWGVTISVHSGTGTNYFDDFMFYPVEGNIKGSVYNPGNGRVIAELNRMGYATFYTYDEAGRVLDTQQEIPGTGVKLVKRNSYNFSRTN